jgi:molybdopterin-containing oxidoreductase family iron-sulfur binding subunit
MSPVMWRSLEDLADDPRLVETVTREFPLYADEMLAPSRRDFLRLMGASVALAGMTACRRWPTEHIVPFAHTPEGYVPGTALQFASSFDHLGAGRGVLVTSFDGRPVKIEGNPLHPASLGSTDAITQAAVLELYDPDRSTALVERGPKGEAATRTWEEFAKAIEPVLASHRSSGGLGLRVLAEPSSSPTQAALRARFAEAFPKAVWVEWDPLSRDAEREGMRLAFGRPLRRHLDLGAADVVAAFDADLLVDDPQSIPHSRAWAARRRGENGSMNRLWVVETTVTLTGAAADHRLAIKSGLVPVALGRVAAHLARAGVTLPAEVARFESHAFDDKRLDKLAEDLLKARGRAVVVVGPSQPAAAHALAAAINAGLSSGAVHYTEDPDPARPPHASALVALGGEIDAGLVETLFILGGNPAYDGPRELDLETKLKRVKRTIRLGLYDDETSASCTWHLPRAHALEAWGDTRSWDGSLGVAQPLIEPLYDGKSTIELLSLLVDGRFAHGYDLVHATHGDAGWRRIVHDGVSAGTALPPVAPTLDPGFAGHLAGLADERTEGDELTFRRSASLLDGRFANLGWLVELPDPATKLTWDNALLVSPQDAEEMKLEGNGALVKLTANGKDLTIPVYVLPGQAVGAFTVSLGWGRTRAGRVGTGIGTDAYALRFAATPWRVEAKVQSAGGRVRLATTQDHQLVDALGKREARIRGEELVRTGTLAEFREHPDFAKERVHVPEDAPLWQYPVPYDGHKWGMAIDLTACVGCHACTIACQAENNIPVVGKDEVLRGREMHWIRVDRYFVGSPEAPSLAFQPMTCHHCENAPCEPVCPVAATVHDHEGLNVMVYNRCIGTRYCANNCPYKVRRFNYFNNHKHETSVEMMVFNPDVTVRARGVMEKCSYCVQRINAVKITAKNAGRTIEDGEIVPACAQACPTQAIVFGDLNLADSRVRKAHEDPRAYGVLEEINTRPRTRYLARLTNPADGGSEA